MKYIWEKQDELIAELKEITEELKKEVERLSTEVSELRIQRLIERGHFL